MWIKMISFARKSTDLFKKNYLKEEGSGFWEKDGNSLCCEE